MEQTPQESVPQKGLQIIDKKVFEITNPDKWAELSPGVFSEHCTKLEDLIPGIDLKGVVSLDRIPKKIKAYEARVMEGESLPHAFSTNILHYLKALEENNLSALEYLKRKFTDTVIVDIGAGGNLLKRAVPGYEIACRLGARGYIAVEPFNFEKLIAGIIYQGEKFKDSKNNDIDPVPFNVAIEDALKFLKRLPDGSVSLISSGIDHNIVSNEGYRQETSEEMTRVLAQGHLCLVSDSIQPVVQQNIKVADVGLDHQPVLVFEKE